MAGAGRGPLRIAIEDFLQTTPVGRYLQSRVVEMGERIENLEGGYYSWFRNAINSTPDIPADVKARLPLASGAGHQGGILSILGFATNLGAQAASALFAPLGRLMNYTIDNWVKSARIDPSAGIRIRWRTGHDDALLASDMAQLGWDPRRINQLEMIMRPRPDEGQLVHQYFRGLITKESYVTQMQDKGYSPWDIDTLEKVNHLIPGIQDLIMMAVREAFNDETSRRFEYDAEYPAEVEKWAKMQGLDPEHTKRYWRAHWTVPSPTQMYDMLHRLRPGTTANPFTREDAELLLKTADYPRFWRSRLIEISYNPYTRVDTRRMFKLGVLDEAGVKSTYLDLGYDDKHAQALTDFTKKYETTSGTSIKDEYADLTLGLLETAYTKGALAEADFRDALGKMGYAGEVVELILKVAELRRVVTKAPDTTNEFLSKVKTMVMNAYSRRVLTEGEANEMLSSVGYAGEDAAALLRIASFDYELQVRGEQIQNIGERFTGNVIDRSQAVTELGSLNMSGAEQSQILAEWDFAALHRTKQLSEAQYRAAWIRKILTQEQYASALQGLGYTDPDIEILIMLYAPGEVPGT